ncbi:hypothetical protein [Streptomyces sp. NBC_01171]|uniref:hypothetical protein n=1 Tax=Streptomyces sp. NBC_01171 TaxID=2903757 RepID=UPI003862F229|nr:hypothetical protein OG448_00225 [Streptomyces sp. NBC_01171]
MLNFKGFGHGLPMEIVMGHLLTGGGPDGMDAKVVPVQVVRGDEPRAWTDIHAAIVDLLGGHLPATDRR